MIYNGKINSGGLKFERTQDLVKISNKVLEFKFHISKLVNINIEGDILILDSNSKAQLNTAISILKSWIIGFEKPYVKELEIAGVGYWVKKEGDVLTFKLRYSHLVNYTLPKDIDCKLMGTRKIILSSINKQLVGQVSQNIVDICRPNPYRRNGIYIIGKYYPIKKSSKG